MGEWMPLCKALCDALAVVDDFDGALAVVRGALQRLGVTHTDVRHEHVLDADDHTVPLPVIGTRGVLATIMCRTVRSFTTRQISELMLIATCFSVWCVERGVGAQGLEEVRLTPRQLATARLAAGGATNAEIAVRLEVSINTVKMRLKQVFERLDVSNRTELANVLRRSTAAPMSIAR